MVGGLMRHPKENKRQVTIWFDSDILDYFSYDADFDRVPDLDRREPTTSPAMTE